MLHPGDLTCLAPVLPRRACSLSKVVLFPLVCVCRWPAERAPGLLLTEMLSHPRAPLWVRALASGKSQELTQTIPFWEKVLAKMVAKQLQGHLSPAMISLFPL